MWIGRLLYASLHLAECRANYSGKHTVRAGSAMMVDGERRWVTYETLEIYADDSGEIGQAFDAAHPVGIQRIAQAEVHFSKQRAVVDFAIDWMEQHRDLAG